MAYYQIESTGDKNTLEFKLYIKHKSQRISPFHGIQLYSNKDTTNIVNMVIEIPQGMQEKMEISKDNKLNPIMYDIRNGKIRLVTYKAKGTNKPGYPFHYGALPQTWEHNGHIDRRTGYYGDNDPIDAFDISSNKAETGTIRSVKILGAFAMIDDNETDWKIICIDINDKNADKYNNIDDVPTHIIDTIDNFLTNYKTPEGKPQNNFADKKLWNKDESEQIVKDVHKFWKQLVSNKDEIVEENRLISENKAKATFNISIVQSESEGKFEKKYLKYKKKYIRLKNKLL